MKFKSFFVISLSALLVACSPHPGTGVWKANTQNALGIDRLTVSFNGRAEFVTSGPEAANWHCFWAGINKQQIELDCKPSTNPDNKQVFVLAATTAGQAKLMQQKKTLAEFTLLDEDPELEEK
jgi:hypothetical protein